MRKSVLFCAFLIPLFALSQTSPKVYWFQFTDKGNTPYSLEQPQEFLSQRAIDRRNRQGISLDSTDLPVDPAYIQAVVDEGAIYLTQSKWFNSVTVAVFNDEIRDSILDLPFIRSNQPVARRPEPQSPKENKWSEYELTKSVSDLAYSENDYGFAFNQIDMLGGVSLHNQGYRGEGMVIAVLDAGFPNVNTDEAFQTMRDNGRLLGGWDFVSKDDLIFEDHPHGLSVLSTMASYLPGRFIGTAPEASYLLCRTENANSEFPIELDYWVAGAEFADSAGADVINSSLGYTTFDQEQFDFTYADMDGNTIRGSKGADMAASKGILVVNSAGNSGNDAWRYIGAPADGDSVLAIGAVTADGAMASFSSFGPSADGDVKPNVCAQGFQATVLSTSGSVVSGNGTSFAGPIMAGMAACLWQANYETATNMDIFRAIEQSAHLYDDPADDYGYGIPNFAKANLALRGLNPEDPDKSELFPLYPNPFNDAFQGTFYSHEEQEVLIRLVNSLGQEVRRIEAVADAISGATFTFNGLQDLHEGVYTLQIVTEERKYFRKLVKVRN